MTDLGIPSARALILKNVDQDGWQFAVHAASSPRSGRSTR
jgi:pyridoxine/pyridoxamine 5'-phosphate oxidase